MDVNVAILVPPIELRSATRFQLSGRSTSNIDKCTYFTPVVAITVSQFKNSKSSDFLPLVFRFVQNGSSHFSEN